MILDLLKTRKSVRNFSKKKVSDEIINYVLEAGRLSPSGGNEQPWKFGVITDKELINQIANIAYNQNWIETVNFLIVLCTCIVDKDHGGRDIQKSRFPHLSKEIENMDDELYSSLNLEEHQTKIAGTHMVLAALEHDVTSTWISYFNVAKVNKLLKLPQNCIASEVIAFGYPLRKENVTPKKSLDEIIFHNVYMQ